MHNYPQHFNLIYQSTIRYLLLSDFFLHHCFHNSICLHLRDIWTGKVSNGILQMFLCTCFYTSHVMCKVKKANQRELRMFESSQNFKHFFCLSCEMTSHSNRGEISPAKCQFVVQNRIFSNCEFKLSFKFTSNTSKINGWTISWSYDFVTYGCNLFAK